MNKNDQDFIANRIRTQYMEKESTELDALRELDARVKRPVSIFAYVLGAVGSLVLGTGMCLAMEVLGTGMMIPGIAIGAVGILAVSLNYPIYKKLLTTRKRKYAPEIFRLSEAILEAKGEA